MSDELDSYVDEAMAALDDASVRELEATADLLERRRDGVGKFSGIFSQVAWHREDRSDPSLARFHLREAVSPRITVNRREKLADCLEGGLR